MSAIVRGKYLGSFVVALGLSAAAAPALAATKADEAGESPTVVVHRAQSPFPGLRDEAAMVLIGTALIGLAAAVRRSA
jgi:hypothetical protein